MKKIIKKSILSLTLAIPIGFSAVDILSDLKENQIDNNSVVNLNKKNENIEQTKTRDTGTVHGKTYNMDKS